MPTVKLNDINLDFGTRGDGEPLLLLHGLGSSRRDWEHQIPAFSERFHVVVPSQRGFGDSDKPKGPYSIDQYAADAFALLDHLSIEKCHVLGFSMGGAVAFQMAVQAQHRLHTLTILNSLPSFEVDHWRKHLLLLSRIVMANVVGMKRMARFVSKRLFPEPHQAHLRNTMLERHGTNDKTAYLSALNALKGWTVREQIAGIHIPTLVIAAEDDYTSIDEKRLYVSELPDARLEVIEGSRHATHVDQSERFNHIVLDFLLRHPMTEPEKTVWGWFKRFKSRWLQRKSDGPQEPPRASA